MLNRAKQQCRGVQNHGVCYDAYIEEGVHIEYAGCSDTNYYPQRKQKEGWQVTGNAPSNSTGILPPTHNNQGWCNIEDLVKYSSAKWV
jgi:hypothetical protein